MLTCSLPMLTLRVPRTQLLHARWHELLGPVFQLLEVMRSAQTGVAGTVLCSFETARRFRF